MKICFLVELPKGAWQWADGLFGAMKILEKKHVVYYHLNGVCDCERTDVVFAWGGTLSNTYRNAMRMGTKRVLLFAGGPRDRGYFSNFDVVCFENELHTIEAKSNGVSCITAFGTITKVFRPIKQPKIFHTVYPAAFGLWKRKDLFAKAVRNLRALTFGNIQEHEPECWDVCVENNIAVSPDIPQEVVPYYMAMAHTVTVLPVNHIGGQRTVLEAMAMKLPVIVPSDAPLVCEFAKHGGVIVDPEPQKIKEAILANLGKENTEGYEYVMNNFTEKHYAKKLQMALDRI